MPDVLYAELYKRTIEYLKSETNQSLIKKAYDLAYKLHEGQYRKSGEAYIIHPVRVACILAELHAGPATICAGLLHDVVEDTDYTYENVSEEFGKDVADIVDGVTKVNQLKFVSLEQKQVENHQHMLLAMAKDIRVIVVKLADRLHNIRTLEHLPVEKQERIAREIENNVENRVVNKICDELKEIIYKKNYYNGDPDIHNPEPLRDMVRHEVAKVIQDKEDIIIQAAAEKLADKLSRSKAVREMAKKVAEEELV